MATAGANFTIIRIQVKLINPQKKSNSSEYGTISNGAFVFWEYYYFYFPSTKTPYLKQKRCCKRLIRAKTLFILPFLLYRKLVSSL